MAPILAMEKGKTIIFEQNLMKKIGGKMFGFENQFFKWLENLGIVIQQWIIAVPKNNRPYMLDISDHVLCPQLNKIYIHSIVNLNSDIKSTG